MFYFFFDIDFLKSYDINALNESFLKKFTKKI